MKQNKLALFLIIIGILWTSYKYISKNEKLIIEKNRIDNTLQNQVSYLKKDVDTYDMVLEIPKINLKNIPLAIFTKGALIRSKKIYRIFSTLC